MNLFENLQMMKESVDEVEIREASILEDEHDMEIVVEAEEEKDIPNEDSSSNKPSQDLIPNVKNTYSELANKINRVYACYPYDDKDDFIHWLAEMSKDYYMEEAWLDDNRYRADCNGMFESGNVEEAETEELERVLDELNACNKYADEKLAKQIEYFEDRIAVAKGLKSYDAIEEE